MSLISGIILGAGESRRMGTLKQLLPFGSKTVIETVIDAFMLSDISEVILVLGHQSRQISEALGSLDVKIAINERYMEGMLSSIQCGIRLASDSSEAFMIGLGDQPSILPDDVNRLIGYFRISNKGIVLPVYNGRRGHPVIIHKKYRDDIYNLDPEIGLRHLMQKYPEDICYLDWASDSIARDMDKPEDYERELQSLKKLKGN